MISLSSQVTYSEVKLLLRSPALKILSGDVKSSVVLRQLCLVSQQILYHILLGIAIQLVYSQSHCGGLLIVDLASHHTVLA
jgi:hypothetical protein